MIEKCTTNGKIPPIAILLMKRDNDCFFHSMGFFEGLSSDQVREAVVKKLQEIGPEGKPPGMEIPLRTVIEYSAHQLECEHPRDFEAYIEWLRKSRVSWGGQLEFGICRDLFMRVIQVGILMWSPDNGGRVALREFTSFDPPDGTSTDLPIIMIKVGGHYEVGISKEYIERYPEKFTPYLISQLRPLDNYVVETLQNGLSIELHDNSEYN